MMMCFKTTSNKLNVPYDATFYTNIHMHMYINIYCDTMTKKLHFISFANIPGFESGAKENHHVQLQVYSQDVFVSHHWLSCIYIHVLPFCQKAVKMISVPWTVSFSRTSKLLHKSKQSVWLMISSSNNISTPTTSSSLPTSLMTKKKCHKK